MNDIAKRDGNYVTAIQGVSSLDGKTPTDIWVDPTSHGIIIDATSTYATLDTRYLKLAGDNDPITSGITIQSTTQTEEALILQTTDDDPTKNILEVRGSGGAALTYINSLGCIYHERTDATVALLELKNTSGLGSSGTRLRLEANNNNVGTFEFTPISPGAFRIDISGPSDNLIIKTNGGDKFYFDDDGKFGVNEDIISGTPAKQFQVTSGAAGNVVGIFKAHPSQSANMIEVRNNSGTALSYITASGAALFGDKVMFTQADGNEYIDSLADGYMDYGATTAHRFDNDIHIGGSNKELRFYEGANYVGFEAPALLSDQIWVLPSADGGNNDILTTDGSGNLSFQTLGALGGGAGPTLTEGDMLYWDSGNSAWVAFDAVMYDSNDDVVNIGDGGTTNYTQFESDGAIIFKGEAGLVFGTVSIAKGNTTATSIAVQNTWYQVTQFDTNGESNNATPDHTNDHILITNAGKYEITVDGCAQTAAAGLASIFEFQVYKNNGATSLPISTCVKFAGGGGDFSPVPMSNVVDLAVNDTIEVWVRNMSNTSDIIFESMNLTVTQVAGT